MARPVKVEASVRDRMTQRVQRMERGVARFGRTWERTGRMSQRAARLMGGGIRLINRGLSRLWRRARLAMLMLQVMAGIMGGMAVKAAMDYERSLRQVFTLMDEAGSQSAAFTQKFVDMDATLKGMSTRVKQTPQALAEGLYDVVSTGFEAADAAIVLEAAAEGAYAGLTTVETAAALLTQTLQAYRQEGETASDIAKKSTRTMDMFFNAVNVGVFTFEELGQKFGDVASTAAAFGVKLEDLLAFLSTATVRGVGLDEAVTSARQTLLSIADSTPQTKKALEELFGSSEKAKESFSAQALAEKGLIGVMEELSAVIGTKIDDQMVDMAVAMEENGGDAAGFLAEKIGITVEALSQLFPNIRALKGVLAVSGPGLETYGEHYEHIAENMGAVERAGKEIDKSASGALQGLKAVWAQFKIDVGNIALPWIKSISDNLVEWWGGLPERFARESGQLEFGVALKPGEEQGRAQEIERLWSSADPGEKLGFILRTAWSDALDNLNRWFDGDGKSKLEELGNKVGTTIADVLMGIAGVGGEDVENSIGYRMGKAVWEGFSAGFSESFDAGEFFGSGFVQKVIAGIVALKFGPKILGALLGGVGTAGGGGGAGAAAAGGGLLGTLGKFLGTGGLTAGLLGLLNVGAIGSDLTQEGGWDSGFFGAIAGMFGIGQQSPWGGPSKGEMATEGEVMAMRNNWISPVEHPAAARASQMTPAEISARKAFERGVGNAGKDIEKGGREVDTAAADMRFAGDRQVEAASRMMLAADRLGNVKIGYPGWGDAPGSRADAGKKQIPEANALGSIGTTRKPTLFLAGESGAEDFEFTPHRGGKRPGGARGASVSVKGPLIGKAVISSDMDIKTVSAQLVRELEKALGNG